MGAAFASTDAGTNLQSWYNGQFGKASTSIVTQVTSYAKGLVPGLYNEYTGLKTTATNSINATKDSEVSGTQEEIGKAKDAHILSLNTKKDEISKGLQSQFDKIV